MRTKEEIIKGFKICNEGNCDGCPYKSIRNCSTMVYQDVLTLLESIPETAAPAVESPKLDEEHSCQPHISKEIFKFKNVTVQVLECQECGDRTLVWYLQPDTEDLLNG